MADRKGRRWEEDGKTVSRVTVGAEEAFELVGIADASGAQITSFGGGDVGVLTVPAPLSTTGGGTESTALRVTLANNSTGLVSVDDNDGSLTVDAPVDVPAFVRLSDGAAAISTLPVSTTSAAAEGATVQPATELISGWDGQNVRAATVQALDGVRTLVTHDNLNRRLLEEILIELRAHNNLLLHLLPKDPQQKDARPDLKIAR